MAETISQYDFELPGELIARHPSAERDQSRLMVIDRQAETIAHHRFFELPDFLRANDLLVSNDSRVLKARLETTKRETGGRVELLLVEPLAGGVWKAMAQSSKKVRAGTELIFRDGTEVLVSEVLGDGFVAVRIFEDPQVLCERLGQLPLPPYLGRSASASDQERYQTVYACAEKTGSVAAPTAGLHFTDELLALLETSGVSRVSLTLHVGPGTFMPVRAESLNEHVMHREFYEISGSTVRSIARARCSGGRVVAVGTTSVRTLESLEAPLREAKGATDIFIRAGHVFKNVDALITNFHLPRSTLLMLVSAFAGRDLIKRAYASAVRDRYRFYSYGDAMLIV